MISTNLMKTVLKTTVRPSGRSSTSSSTWGRTKSATWTSCLLTCKTSLWRRWSVWNRTCTTRWWATSRSATAARSCSASTCWWTATSNPGCWRWTHSPPSSHPVRSTRRSSSCSSPTCSQSWACQRTRSTRGRARPAGSQKSTSHSAKYTKGSMCPKSRSAKKWKHWSTKGHSKITWIWMQSKLIWRKGSVYWMMTT